MMTTVLNGYGDSMPKNQQWTVVNDGVMGGLSQSRAQTLESDTMKFSGTISFENNGGFASIRHSAAAFNLRNTTGIRLRVKGDGKKYQFRVRTSQQFDGVAYKHEFSTTSNQWQEFEFYWQDFQATFRGRKVAGAPEIKAEAIEQVGFLIADKQEGSFELVVERIQGIPAP